MTEAQLRLFYERVMALRDGWRGTAINLRGWAERVEVPNSGALDEAKGLERCAADIDAIAKEVGSE